MPKEKTKEEIFNKCEQNGMFIFMEKIDLDKIKTMLNISVAGLEVIQQLIKKTPKESYGWSIIFRNYYDVLRQLVEAFIRFDKIKSLNHQCLFAYLCIKHPELELSWEFFEKIRTKRNGINYYGQPVSYNDFKEIELQLNVYINLLKKKILEKLE